MNDRFCWLLVSTGVRPNKSRSLLALQCSESAVNLLTASLIMRTWRRRTATRPTWLNSLWWTSDAWSSSSGDGARQSETRSGKTKPSRRFSGSVTRAHTHWSYSSNANLCNYTRCACALDCSWMLTLLSTRTKFIQKSCIFSLLYS